MGSRRGMTMASTIQLAVVRYIQDPVRNEPRNVGVIAWAPGQVAARFVGEGQGSDLDLRRVSPLLVTDRKTYGDWVQFWRRHIDAGQVADPIEGATVSVEKQSFLSALAAATRGNYELRLGAEAYLPKGLGLEAAVREAFGRFVEPSAYEVPAFVADDEKGASHRQLAHEAYLTLKKNKYHEEQDFIRHYRALGQTRNGAEVPAVFDLGILPASPGGLFASGRKLLVDAVSFVAVESEAPEVIDRARAVASKATEVRKADPETVVHALVTNGRTANSEVGRWASRILEDEGGLSAITLPQLIE